MFNSCLVFGNFEFSSFYFMILQR